MLYKVIWKDEDDQQQVENNMEYIIASQKLLSVLSIDSHANLEPDVDFNEPKSSDNEFTSLSGGAFDNY